MSENGVNLYSKEFENFISDLAVFADGYVIEIKNHLADIATEIFKDKTIVAMLREYAERVEKSKETFRRDFLSAIRHPETGFTLDGYSLHDPEPFKKVLSSLLIDKWWHERMERERNGNEND